MSHAQDINIAVIGTSFRTAPVDLREGFALGGDLAGRVLRTIHTENVFEEAVILDTCNRTECYFAPSGDSDPVEYFVGLIARVKGRQISADPGQFYCYRGADAVQHLMRVAATLDSQIVGEQQILGQVRAAYREATGAQTSRFLLNKLMHAAFRAGKRVQTETRLSRGSASVAGAAVDLAKQTLGELTGKTAMIIGAGTTARTAARALAAEGAGKLIVANRTLQRAREFIETLDRTEAKSPRVRHAGDDSLPSTSDETACPAVLRRCGKPSCGHTQAPRSAQPRPAACAIELADVSDAIDSADVVVCSTGSDEPILTMDSLSGRLSQRQRPLVIVDIAVPRDAEAALGELPNVLLHSIDDLDRVVADSLAGRREEIPLAEQIVSEEAEKFCQWHNSLKATTIIKQLRQHFEQIHSDRSGKYVSHGGKKLLDAFAHDVCNKILHRPTAYLRKMSTEATTSQRLAAIDTIRLMFGLDSSEDDS